GCPPPHAAGTPRHSLPEPPMTTVQQSWIESANDGVTHFPLQNLPYGIFSPNGQGPRVGVAIGDFILDLSVLDAAGLLPASVKGVFAGATLNAFIALGKPVWTETRERLTALLAADDTTLHPK